MLYQTKTFSKYVVTVILKKRQNEDFQSNGGTYFLAHFCILYWKTKKVLPLCNYIDCSEGTLQCAEVQGMVKCSSFFFLL